MARLFLGVICIYGVINYVSTEKRLLVSDPAFTQQKLQNIETRLQDLQDQLTVNKGRDDAQELKITMQENKIMQQAQTITALEKKIVDQEANITAQQSNVLQQQVTLINIEKNLSGVLEHNFIDEMAQAMCAADTTINAYVYALRRDCASGVAPPCSTLCAHAASKMGDSGHTHVECFDAFAVPKSHGHLTPNPNRTQPDEGKPFMYVYRYLAGNGCITTGCGPNYCCCRAKH